MYERPWAAAARGTYALRVLDPQIQPVVDVINLAAADAPPNVPLDDRRKAYLALSMVAGPGPQLDQVRDRFVPGPAGEIPVRIYRNGGAQGIFVFYHGGGFTIGDLDTHDEVCCQVAKQSDSTVMAVDYRLAPEAPFPAAVEDSWAALQWADSHRPELGGSASSKIVVGGDSAGGTLSAVVALVVTAQYDPLRDQGAEYAEILEVAGVPVTYSNYAGTVHVFFQLGPVADAAARCVTEVSDFAKDALS